ncbi:MAG: N-acetyl-gamma-glutamyl-phosphate reductase [Candidatus Obscuribacterales bacterium]|nr:N-acetyl-gamma-glutamyl-phosphate reductase [Candidatus Obscuribacterales bacterium]
MVSLKCALDNSVEAKDNIKKLKTKIGVAGASGYTGQELIRLLAQHPHVELVALASNSGSGNDFASSFPGFRGFVDTVLCPVDLDYLTAVSDIVFLSLPHGIATNLVTASALSKAKVIDLSGDFRVKSKSGLRNNEIQESAVYGLCEFNRTEISRSSLVANPGCYATAANLSLAPLVKAGVIAPGSIIIDGKSGVSGAGRSLSLKTQYNECNESMTAYQLPTHRHTPEIEATLGQFSKGDVVTTFAAHLVPANRGILLTAYANLNHKISVEEVRTIFEQFYLAEPFIRIMPGSIYPETRWVKGSNFCDIGFAVDDRAGRIVVVSAIDNLGKGAAGQAVQNMNIIMGIDETTGLTQIPTFL